MKSFAPLTSGQTTGEAFAAILRHNLNALQSWQETARSWDDIEGVHQVRVSFRRLRSAFAVFRPALARDDRKAWSAAIRDLVEQTGPARDIDVLVEEALPDYHAANPEASTTGKQEVLRALTARREEAYRRVRAMLDGADFAAFKADFTRWTDASGWAAAELSKKKRKRQGYNIMAFAGRMLDRQDNAVRTCGDATDPGNPAEMHRLRIACKKLRYATEFFFPLYPDMDGFLANLKTIQDTLGLMHDVAVMSDMLDDLLPKDANPAARRYVQGLIDWRTDVSCEKALNFQQQWRTFVAAERPWRQM